MQLGQKTCPKTINLRTSKFVIYLTLKLGLRFIISLGGAILKINEISKLTGLNSSTIRYYEKQGLLGDIDRRNNNYREFNEEDKEKLLFIKKAKSLGLKLDEVKTILSLKAGGTYPCKYVNNKIHENISFIDAQITSLEKEKDRLEKLVVKINEADECDGVICQFIEDEEDNY